MRVGVYYRNDEVRLEERPLPSIGPGEILVKVLRSGICGSDVLEWYRRKKAPLVLGHEITGQVAEVGPGVKGLSLGEIVFVSHHVPCNTCRSCLRGHKTACLTLHGTNYDPGGFAEFIRVPRLNVEQGVFPLPEGVSLDEGVFIEPLACVLRGQRRADLKPGEAVLVLGSGISGILHLALARFCGAGRIFAVDVNPCRLALARRFGADEGWLAADFVPEVLRAANGGQLADLVVVAAGDPRAFAQAFRSVEAGGTILFFATAKPEERVAVPLSDLWRNDIKMLTSYGNDPHDARTAIEILQTKRLPLEEMITHRLPLERIGEGFRLVAQGGPALKVVICPHDRGGLDL